MTSFDDFKLDVSCLGKGKLYLFLSGDGPLEYMADGEYEAGSLSFEVLVAFNGKFRCAELSGKAGSRKLEDIFNVAFGFAKDLGVEFSKHKGERALELTLVTFAGQLILFAIPNFEGSYSAGSIITQGHGFSSRSKTLISYLDRSNNRCYVKALFRDLTMLVPDKETLNDVGNLVGVPKESEHYDTTVMAGYTNRLLSELHGKKSVDLPFSIANYAVRVVQKVWTDALKRNKIDDKWSNRVGYISSKKQSRMTIDKVKSLNTNLGFETALLSSKGGINVAYTSGVVAGKHSYDIDLKSAYNTAGHLIPIIDYSQVSKRLNSPSASKLIDEMRRVNGPYTVGNCRVDIYWPISVKVIPIGVYSVEDDNPHFVRRAENVSMTLTDFWLAYFKGAVVKLYEATIVSQVLLGENYGMALHPCGLAQELMLRKRKAAKSSLEDKFWKQAGNSIYGKTAQGLHGGSNPGESSGSQKKLSPISDPYVASQYTAITRLHVCLLIDSLRQLQQFDLLNITTDGILISSDQKLDVNALRRVMAEGADSLFVKVNRNFLNNEWFEIKGITDTEVFNIRTRLNGSADGIIHAMSSVHDTSTAQLLSGLHNHQTTYESSLICYPTLAETRRNKKITNLRQPDKSDTETKLFYDWSNRPVSFISSGDLGYYVTRPFTNLSEQKNYKEVANRLAKRYFIYEPTSASYFIRVMNNVMKRKLKIPVTITLSYEIKEFVKFCAYMKFSSELMSETWSDIEIYLNSLEDGLRVLKLKTLKNAFGKYRKREISLDEINFLAAAKVANAVSACDKKKPVSNLTD